MQILGFEKPIFTHTHTHAHRSCGPKNQRQFQPFEQIVFAKFVASVQWKSPLFHATALLFVLFFFYQQQFCDCGGLVDSMQLMKYLLHFIISCSLARQCVCVYIVTNVGRVRSENCAENFFSGSCSSLWSGAWACWIHISSWMIFAIVRTRSKDFCLNFKPWSVKEFRN